MSKQESFKNFVKENPALVEAVKEKRHTWQDFYEIYDMYGEKSEVWNKYLKESDSSNRISLAEITALMKGVNLTNVQKYVTNCQKAINVIQELATKAPTKVKEIPKAPRPITKFFGD